MERLMICKVVRTSPLGVRSETTTKEFATLLAAASFIDEMEEKIEGWWNEVAPRNFECTLIVEGLSIRETVVNDAGVFTGPPENFEAWDFNHLNYTSGPNHSGEFMGCFQTWLIEGLNFEYGLDDGDVYRILQVYLDGNPIVAVSIGHGGYTSHRYKWNEINCEYEGVS
jgi:hypothetical protein